MLQTCLITISFAARAPGSIQPTAGPSNTLQRVHVLLWGCSTQKFAKSLHFLLPQHSAFKTQYCWIFLYQKKQTVILLVPLGFGIHWLSWGCPIRALSHISHVPNTHQPCKTGSLNASLSEMDKASAPQGGMWAIGNSSLGTNVLPETYTCSFFRLRWQVVRQVNKAVCTSTQLQGDLEPKWGIYVKDEAEPLELSGALDLEHQIDVIRQVYCCI